MRKLFPTKRILLFGLGLPLLVFQFALSSPVYADNVPEKVLVAEASGLKTITRQPDPITVSGAMLQAVNNLNQELIGLFAAQNNSLTAIPFQVDSRDENDKYILTDIVSKAIPEAPIFDFNDEIIFMAKDLGDRCLPEMYPEDWQNGVEIEVTDPLNGAQGWAYLFSFASPPARAERSYTRYFMAQEGKDVMDTEVFNMGFPPIEKDQANVISDLKVKKVAGGSEENVLDRMKERINIKFLFSFFEVNITEDNLRSELIAYKDGPVKIFRRIKTSIYLPFGLKSPGFVADSYYYETIITGPMEASIPFKLNHVLSSFIIRVGFDYNPHANGAKFYNSLNMDGFVVDGKPAPEETNMDHGTPDWNLLTGDFGTLMRRNIKVGLAQKYFKITEYIWDEEAALDPPENFPGNFGHTYQFVDIINVPRGRYFLKFNFFVLPNFNWGDQYEYLKIDDSPLEVKTEIIEHSTMQ